MWLKKLQMCIIFGGYSDRNYTNSIFCLDFNHKTCNKLTHIRCPNASSYYSFLLPSNNEMKVHLFQYGKNHFHHSIPFNAVLSNNQIERVLLLLRLSVILLCCLFYVSCSDLKSDGRECERKSMGL